MSRLFLDASRDRLSVGIAVGSTWLAYNAIEGRHDQVLLESIRSLCEESGLPINELAECVVVNGPGSFTGLRIAVSCIHALDLVHPLQVLPIDQLSLLAAASDADVDCALLDARMDEVYVGSDRQADGTFACLELMPVSELDHQRPWVCHAEECDRFPIPTKSVSPTLETLKGLSLRLDSSKWISGHQLTPLYVRQTVSWKPLSEQPSKLYDY
ncbi:MAG: tRNA (adenosine(37)-N6)-threonylcarbamoyltransferase complex dimerization subunit type 1 TsaB [Gammaproteobacteria bacterium]|jgi:tRNA threonylcarbamoyl adenosine modification protein YeaZ|nr:tRNA (adenosine(37)-N6)-threonylcarbamoyltransferase complex dimerization subunit type 1 TsaB [Gammaproteobacteria bacterium]